MPGVSRKPTKAREFGDFQTPNPLASLVIQVVSELGIVPRAVIEPTCGQGAFLLAAAKAFPGAQRFVGVDINQRHLDVLQARIAAEDIQAPIEILCADFFSLDWRAILRDLAEPILIIGNPPWVTNAELGALQSANLPQKSNRQGHRGIEALTGKSNFDISEAMLLQYLEWLQASRGTIAVLCKTAVARKVLFYAWRHRYPVTAARLYGIDAARHFNASVDACLFVVHLNQEAGAQNCDVFEGIGQPAPTQAIGYLDGQVIADVALYERWRHLRGVDSVYQWRSGIKHDCAQVMELERSAVGFRNGYGASVPIEATYVYPMFKSSDIANGLVQKRRRYMLVTQALIGDDTSHIAQDAPKTWQYLQDNAAVFSRRSSSIYKNRPLFSVFGVGPYTFAPWKVAISGFYKSLSFRVVGPIEDRPAVFDDTIYFLACWSEQEAEFVAQLLDSQPAQEFFRSMIFWSDKRPITVNILKRLNLAALARLLGREEEYRRYASARVDQAAHPGQLRLFVA